MFLVTAYIFLQVPEVNFIFSQRLVMYVFVVKPEWYSSWIECFFVTDCVVPIRDGQSVSTVLGVLGCLRNVLPHVSVGEGGEGEMRGSFGVRRCHQEAPLAVDRMIQVVRWSCTKFMWLRIGTTC